MKHPLFVTNDDIRSFKFKETIKAIIAIDDAAIKVIKVGGSKATAIELNHRAQFGRNDGDNGKNHPFGLITGFAEGLDDFEATNGANTFLTVRRI